MPKSPPNILTAAALLPCLLYLSGCLLNPAIFKKGAFAVDDWETWTSWNDAFGSHEVSASALTYRLAENQDDTHDTPTDGRSPGLLLSRPLSGADWRAEVRATFQLPAGTPKRFSFGIRLGDEYARPSLGGAAFRLLAQRSNGPAPADEVFLLSATPAKAPPVKIPNEVKALRFERAGNLFSVSYSQDGRLFTPAMSVKYEAADAAAAQAFFIGGRADGEAQGASARFTSLKINGSETLR